MSESLSCSSDPAVNGMNALPKKMGWSDQGMW